MRRKSNWLMLLLIMLAALTGIMCLPDKSTSQEAQVPSVEGQPTPPPAVSADELDRASRSFVQLSKYAAPAVVNINVTKTISSGFQQGQQFAPGDEWFFKFFEPYGGMPREYKQRGQGSGFIIDAEGYIVTNDHVVTHADVIQVTLNDEKKVEAEIVGTDPKTDLALLKVKEADAKAHGPFPTLPLGDSDSLEVGEWVIAIGNPFGLEHTVTAGIVSAKGRIVGFGNYDDYIQTDASINPGNSGGPLINTKGQVIGINSMINPSGQGIGFAIPSNQAKAIVGQLRQSGSVTRGWLGVYIQSVTPEIAEAVGLDEVKGAIVSQVLEGSPADAAGFEVQDVILRYDGTPIDKSHDLPNLVAATNVGKTVYLDVLRGGKPRTIKAVIGQLPDEEVKPSEEISRNVGITVQNITPEIASQMGIKAGQGVIVAQVEPGSPAEDSGLRRGDVILEVNKVAVSTTDEFQKQIEKAKDGKRILMLVKREDGTFFTTIKP